MNRENAPRESSSPWRISCEGLVKSATCPLYRENRATQWLQTPWSWLRLSVTGRDAKLRAEHVRLRTALSENERLTLPFSSLIV